jgi:hypothetical protein
MDIVDMAMHPAPKARPFTSTSKTNFRPKCASLSKIFWCKKLTHGALQK